MIYTFMKTSVKFGAFVVIVLLVGTVAAAQSGLLTGFYYWGGEDLTITKSSTPTTPKVGQGPEDSGYNGERVYYVGGPEDEPGDPIDPSVTNPDHQEEYNGERVYLPGEGPASLASEEKSIRGILTEEQTIRGTLTPEGPGEPSKFILQPKADLGGTPGETTEMYLEEGGASYNGERVYYFGDCDPLDVRVGDFTIQGAVTRAVRSLCVKFPTKSAKPTSQGYNGEEVRLDGEEAPSFP